MYCVGKTFINKKLFFRKVATLKNFYTKRVFSYECS